MSNPAEVLLQVYGQATMARIAQGAGATGPDPYAALTELMGDKTRRRTLVDAMPVTSRELLAFMGQFERRLRGERLKRRWFLHGYAEFEQRITPLIEAGVVIVGNVGAREPLSLETALEQGLLQQWLQVSPGFEGLAGEAPKAREVVEQFEDETVLEVTVRTLVLEYNLLAAARFTEAHKIRLNRDGSPHRSDLKAMAPLIIDRHGGGSEHVIDPNSMEGWDLLVFILSIGEALGCVERRDDTLRARNAGFDFFRKSLAERIPLLLRALETQRAWSEVHAAVWKATGEPPTTGQGDGGFLVEGGPGANLAGARGSVLSALRRLQPHDWFNIEDTVATIGSLEHQYLATVLPSAGDEIGIASFVRAVITQTLVHVGAVDLGRGSDGTARARLTPVGRTMLGVGEPPVEPDGTGALMVEPSFEITCFLDQAPLRLLYDLSRFAESAHTSERVVRYRLVGESVQWGYARGYTADSITSILTTSAARQVPGPVTFALQDWERLHRRVTVFLSGDIIAATGKSDPEVVQSGVQFAIDRDSDLEIIDFTHTFVVAGHKEPIDRALMAHKPRVIDYNGPIVPSLHWIDDKNLHAPLGGTDFRLLARLGRFCEADDDDVFRIHPPKIKAAFGIEAGFARLVQLLREGVVGGLTAERELQLKQLLDDPAKAKVETMEVLVVGSADDGDRIARIQPLNEFVAARLGPRSFHVIPGCTAKLLARLRELGVKVES